MYPMSPTWLIGWVEKLAMARAQMIQAEAEQHYDIAAYHHNEYQNILHQFEYDWQKMNDPPMDKGISNSVYYQYGKTYWDDTEGNKWVDNGDGSGSVSLPHIPAPFFSSLVAPVPFVRKKEKPAEQPEPLP